MFILMLTILGISLLLVVLSFFLRDPVKDLREDIDQLSIQQVQEIYKLKKKVKILEEELMMGDGEFSMDATLNKSQPYPHANIDSVHAIIKSQVWTLASQGVSIEKIANQSSLTTSQVQQIIKERDVENR